ncbi:MAG TPA: inositol monophosphatase family protein [Polyangia bacterium]|nr:inositol monophosphatase family protein [Polyangia bacterium]
MNGEAGESLLLAREIARDAAAILRDGWSAVQSAGVGICYKSGRTDLVTEYDRKSEACIVRALASACPDDAVVAEESGARGARGARRRWLVDPLDGTTNFAHGLPLFAVSIGLEIAGQLAAGVVVAPALGWEFAACAGGGATLNGKLLRVSSTGALERALLVTGFPYDRADNPENNFANWEAFQRRAQGVRRLGAAALDLCFVAAGWLDGYWEYRLQPWDLAAGSVIAREAGACLTDWRGGPFHPDAGEIVCSNGPIHDAMLALLRAVRAAPPAPPGS